MVSDGHLRLSGAGSKPPAAPSLKTLCVCFLSLAASHLASACAAIARDPTDYGCAAPDRAPQPRGRLHARRGDGAAANRPGSSASALGSFDLRLHWYPPASASAAMARRGAADAPRRVAPHGRVGVCVRMKVMAPPPIDRLLLDFNISSSSRSPSSASRSLRLGLAKRGVPARAQWARAVGVPASRKLRRLRAPHSALRAALRQRTLR